MGYSNLIIILVTAILVILSGFLPGPREWWQSIIKKPLVSLLVLGSFLSVFLGQPRSFQAVAENPIDVIRLARVVLLSLLAMVSFLGIAFNIRSKNSTGYGIKWMISYALFAMISTVYSSIPLLTLWKGFEVLSITIVGVHVGTKIHEVNDIQDVLNIILLFLWVIVIGSLVGSIVAPATAFTKMQSTETMAFALQAAYPRVNANTLTQIAGLLAACSFLRIINPGKNYSNSGPLFVFIISLICLTLSHSRTSIIAFILVVIFTILYYRKVGMILSSIWLCFLVGMSGAVVKYLIPYFMRGQSEEVFTSLSGRTTFWPEVLSKIAESPFGGHGFYASQRVMWNLSSVDNAYLEVLLGLGLIGVVLLILPLLSIIYNLWKSRPWKVALSSTSDARYVWMQLFVFFIFLFIRSLSGPSFQNLHINLIIFVSLIVTAYKLKRIIVPNIRRQYTVYE